MSKKSAAALVLTLVVSLPTFALGRIPQPTPPNHTQQILKKVKHLIVGVLEDLGVYGPTTPKP